MTQVDEIKSRLDIVEFIRGYIKLEKTGANWKAVCPFHSEKTPSFFVSPSRQMWHCFGCHKGGDAFKFLMELEHLEFPEVLKILAERTGVELQREDPRLRSERNRMLEVLETATQFFEGELARHAEAKTYLVSRGLKEETVREFRLGFAPSGWQNLIQYFSNRGFGANELAKAGLAIAKTDEGSGAVKSFYDRFRSRIIFPIADSQGRVVGFTGRVFGEAGPTEPKYLNTPESLVFSKSHILYGFDKSKHEIRRQNAAVLTEGQMDYLMAWQEGTKNVVATSGTALSQWHLATLKRLCENLYLAFDMDEAGSQATERGIAMAAGQGFTLHVIELTSGKDIADFVKEFPQKLVEAIAHAVPIMEYYFGRALGKLVQTANLQSSDAGVLESKKSAIAYLLPRIKMMQSPVDQSFWIEKLAQKLGLSEEALNLEFKNTEPMDTEALGSTSATQFTPTIEIVPQKDRLQLVAERALALASKLPEQHSYLEPFIAYFPPQLQNLAQGKQEGVSPEFLNYLGLHGDYVMSLLKDISLEAELATTLKELKREHLKRALGTLSRDIEVAELAKDEEKLRTLSTQFVNLSKELSI